MQANTICEVSRIEDRMAAQEARDDRNATPAQRAIRAIPRDQMTAKVALAIIETLQAAFIRAKNDDLDIAIGEMDSVADALYRVREQQAQSDKEELSNALRAYNPYTDV